MGLHIRPTKCFFREAGTPRLWKARIHVTLYEARTVGLKFLGGMRALASFGWRVSDLLTPCRRLFLSVHAVGNFALAEQCRRWRSRFYSDRQWPSLR